MNLPRLAVAHEAANLTELARATVLAALTAPAHRSRLGRSAGGSVEPDQGQAVDEGELVEHARAALGAAQELLQVALRLSGSPPATPTDPRRHGSGQLSFAERYPEEAAADLADWLRSEADRVPDGLHLEVLGEPGQPR